MTFSFTGTLPSGNAVQLFDFSLSAPSTVTLGTFSYAGGVNAAGATIPAGGFDPIVAVFDASGALIGLNDNGASLPVDQATGAAFDSLLSVALGPGDYTVALSQFPNFPSGSALSDGFDGGAAEDFGGRTANWALDIVAVDFAALGELLFGGTSTSQTASSAVAASPLQTQTAPLTPTLITRRVAGWSSAGRSPRGRGVDVAGDRAARSGLAAGDGPLALPGGVWASYSRGSVENDLSSTAFDAAVSVFLIGADWNVTPSLLAGVAVGHESQDVDTFFNGGGQEVDGVTVAGYLGYRFNDAWSVDAALGGAWFNTDQFRRAGALRITSDVDSSRMYASANLNGFWQRGRWLASTRAGVLWAEDDFDAFTERTGLPGGLRNGARTIDLGQVSVGGDVGYQVGSFVPFVNAQYVHDYKHTAVRVAAGQARPSNDRDEVQVGFGLRYFGAGNGVSATAEVTSVQGREDLDSLTVAATVRIEL